MADDVFGVEVVTPEQSLVAGGATAIVLATSEGDLTVLDGHTPLVGDVVPGLVKVDLAEGADAPDVALREAEDALGRAELRLSVAAGSHE